METEIDHQVIGPVVVEGRAERERDPASGDEAEIGLMDDGPAIALPRPHRIICLGRVLETNRPVVERLAGQRGHVQGQARDAPGGADFAREQNRLQARVVIGRLDREGPS